jgi:hypothetical protein
MPRKGRGWFGWPDGLVFKKAWWITSDELSTMVQYTALRDSIV